MWHFGFVLVRTHVVLVLIELNVMCSEFTGMSLTISIISSASNATGQPTNGDGM